MTPPSGSRHLKNRSSIVTAQFAAAAVSLKDRSIDDMPESGSDKLSMADLRKWFHTKLQQIEALEAEEAEKMRLESTQALKGHIPHRKVCI